MAALPELNEEPIINVQRVSSSAEGNDAFAKVLGGIAEHAAAKVETMNEEQSNALAMQAQNSISDTVTGAHINMINDPANASKIVDQSRDAINTMVSAAYVNDADRRKLKSIGMTSMNQVELLGATTQHQQLKADTAVSFYNEAPKALQDINRYYLTGNLEAAAIRQDNLLKTAASAMRMGAISPQAYERVVQGIAGTVDSARMKVDMIGKGDATAYDYHESNNTVYGAIHTNPATTPTDHYTTSNVAHYDSEASAERIETDLYRYGHVTDINAYNTKLTEHQLTSLHGKWIGVNQAQAMIQSGMDHIQVDKVLNDLQSKKKTGLTLAEEGKYNYLRNFYDRLENGEYLDVMKSLPMGARIVQEKTQSDTAIESSTLSSEEKAFRLKENEDWERQQFVNLGMGLHMNPKYIKVMSDEAMVPFKAGFQTGQNPDLVISNLRATDQKIHPYIADAMDKQNQAQAMMIISNAGNGITQGIARDLIIANQDGFDKGLINVDKDSQTYKKIIGAVANDANVQTAIRYMSYLPNDQKGGQSVSDGTITALANTVILQAKRAGDLGVDNLSTYVSNLSTQIKKSYNMYQDQNSRINNATLKLADADLKSIGRYAKDQAYDRLRLEKTPIELLDFQDRNPLMLINTPNNVFVLINSTTGDIALDKSGQPLFEWPYTDTLRRSALHHQSKYETEDSKRVREFKETHPFGRTFQ